MTQSRPVADREWKQLTSLVEQLVDQPTLTDQVNRVIELVSESLSAQARFWLVNSAYPLPMNDEKGLLSIHDSPDIVHKAADQLQTQTSSGMNGSKKNSLPICAAVPLTAHEHLLGVLEVERSTARGFSKREIEWLEGLAVHASVAMEVTRQERLKNWRYEQLNLVRSVSAQISNLRNPQELYTQVTQLIQQTFHFYYVAIFTPDQQQNRLHFRASAGHSLLPPDFTMEMGEGIIGTAGKNQHEVIAPDVRLDARYRHLDALPETLSEAAIPLKVEERLLGVLDVQSDLLNAFHDTDMLVLHTLSDSVALAMESAHLYDDLHRRVEQISSVFEVSHALVSILDLDALLAELVQLIQKRFGYPFVHVYTVHPGRRRIIYEAGSGERSAELGKLEVSYPLDSEKGIIPWVARNGQTFFTNDVLREPLYVPAELPPYETRAELTVPLSVGNEVLGVLDIQSKEPNAFDENDRFLFEALAATIATALRNASLYRSEQWRRMVAESFRDVAYLITTNQPLDDLLNIILEKLENNLPCDASAIWLLEDAQNQGDGNKYRLQLAATRNIQPESVLQVVRGNSEAQAMLERALDEAQPLIRQPGDPAGPLGAALHFSDNYSSIAAPMLTGHKPLGILTLAHSANGRYGSEAQAITATFANYAAVAIQNARLYHESQEQALISTMLLQVAEASQSILTVDDLLTTMVRLTRLLIGVRKCAFLLWEDSLQLYELKAWYGFEPAEADGEAGSLFPPTLPAFARLSDQKTTIYLENPLDELNMPEISLAPETGIQVMLPLLVRGEVMGAFLVALQTADQSESEQGFDPKALSILQGIAHQTAMTVDNLRLLDARQEEAYVTAALLQVAQAVVSSNDLHDTLDTVVHLLPILVGIDTCVIYLWDPSSRLFRPIQAYASSRREEETLLSSAFAPGEYKLLDASFNSSELHICEVTQPNSLFPSWAQIDCQSYSQVSEQTALSVGDWLLAYPLSMQNIVMGVMLVQEKNMSPSFWERRLEIINGIAQQVSLAIQNDIFKQEMVENERIEREVQLARQIQETFLPTSLPRLDGWELDLRWETAREVGGDFYDVFRLEGNRLGLVIADVSDKGLPAALYMTVTRTLIHAYAADGGTPARVLEEVNELLVNDLPESMFITVVYAILSLDSGELVYANAGHNLPLMYRLEQEQVEQLPKGGTALGILTDLELENHIIHIEPGDVLTLFTDGVVDILSPQTESFGEERLRQMIAQNGKLGVDALLENLDDALIDFRQGTRQFDDVTIVAIRRKPETT